MNFSFAEWAQTVFDQPLPVHVGLERIDKVLADQKLITKSQQIAFEIALAWYAYTHGRSPQTYTADVAFGTTHYSFFQYPLDGNLPTYVQPVFKGSSPEDQYTYYMLNTAFNSTTPINPLASTLVAERGGIKLASNNVGLHPDPNPQKRLRYPLFTAYDTESSKWTQYTKGYWQTYATTAVPTMDSGTVVDSNATNHSTILIPNITQIQSKGNMPLIQLFFYTSLDETLSAYPAYGISSGNPYQMRISDNAITVDVSQAAPMFVTNFTARSSGYWRATVFYPPINMSSADYFDSGWNQVTCSPGQTQFKWDVLHKFNQLPEAVQVYFSVTGQESEIYLTAFQDLTHPGARNPATVHVQPNDIILHMICSNTGGLYSTWDHTASANQWTEHKTGYFRVVAVRNLYNLDPRFPQIPSS